MKFFYKIIAMFFFTLAISTNSFAGGLYSPHTIVVDETALTAVKAKKKAFVKAKKQAWIELLNDLYWVQTEDSPALSVQELNEVIQTIDVNKEKTRNNRYLADIVVYFNPTAVRSMFVRKNIVLAGERAFPILVVPVWNSAGSEKIYELGNEWRRALSENPKIGGSLPVFFVPDGLKPSLKIDSTVIKNHDKLMNASKDYGAVGAIIATVTLRNDGDLTRLYLNWHSIGGFLEGSSDVIITDVKSNYKDELAGLTYSFYTSIEKKWRSVQEKSKVLGNQEQLVIFKTYDLQDLQRLKESMRSISAVEKVEIKSISGGLVTLLLKMHLEKEKFKVILERAGYVVMQGKRIWVAERPKG